MTYNEILGCVSSNEGKFLNEKEIQGVLNVMILDDSIKKVQDKYEINKDPHFLLQSNTNPCEKCNFFDVCEVNTLVSPEKCLYLEDW